MAIGKKVPDEYQLPGEDFNEPAELEQPSEEPATPTQSRWSGLLRHKKVLIGVGLIAAIIIVYEFTGISSTQPTQPQLQKIVAQPSSDTSNQLTSLANQNQNLTSSIATLTQQNAANTATVNQLQNSLSELTASQNQLSNQLATITDTLQNLSLQVEKLMPKPKPVKRPVKYVPPPPVFHLKAVLPGRAWLQSNQGKTMTVTLGDKLQGYGTVTWINAESGAVNTSSGKIIRYGANDY